MGVSLLVACALVAGCGSSSGKQTAESKSAVDSMRGTRQELVKAKTDVQQANAALDRLAAGGNVEQAYQQYTKEVADVKAAGERARARATDMQSRGRQYVAAWEKEMDQISNPELKAGATQRRAMVKQNFDDIMTTARSVKDAYQPYLRDLQDIQKALANDLTPAGINAARPTMEKTKAEGQALQERLDALIAHLDKVTGSMSTTGGGQASAK